VIEEIVADYVRYDVDHKGVFLTPEAHHLSNKAKVLIYLVALQGWQFVINESVPADAKPSEIEEGVGITGGSLRPVLKELKDRKIIVEKGGRYSVLSAALGAVKAELDGSPTSPRKTKKPSKTRKAVEARTPKDNQASEKPHKRKSNKATPSANISERFESWIDEGFFDKPKSLSDVQKRFHKEAVLVPQTSLPTYLLKAVRQNRLARDKEDVGGKKVWVYQKAE
jgi:hypothetical protein